MAIVIHRVLKMKFKKLLIPILAGLTQLSLAAVPSIAVKSLEWPKEATPDDNVNYRINTVDLRGALISSGKWKVIETPKNFSFDSASEANQNDDSAATTAKVKDNRTYILIGVVQSSRWYENATPKSQGSEYTTAYKKNETLVSYKLVDAKDKATVAAFSVNAIGKQVVTLAAGQKINADVGQIIQDASKDLANKTMERLNEQIAGKGIIDRHSISGIKTYDD